MGSALRLPSLHKDFSILATFARRRRDISTFGLRQMSATRKAAFAAHELSRKIHVQGHLHNCFFAKVRHIQPTRRFREFSCAAKAAFRVRRGTVKTEGCGRRGASREGLSRNASDSNNTFQPFNFSTFQLYKGLQA